MLNEMNSRNVSKFAMFLENENLKINILENRHILILEHLFGTFHPA